MAPKTRDVVAPASIQLHGVRTHNLRNVDVGFPMGRLTVVTGLSGSGKSSLAFDTLYAEGQRRYVESLSAYTRQFLERMKRPDVDRVSSIPPAIAALRKPPAKTSRSTVGTVTEILDYLRMLYARVATLSCVSCGREVRLETTTGITDRLLDERAGERATIVFPLAREAGPAAFERLRREGYFRVTRDGRVVHDLHDGDVHLEGDAPYYAVADRLRLGAGDRSRLTESLDAALSSGEERASVFTESGERIPLARGFHCAHCDRAYGAPRPQHFSFNSPIGACEACRGFGDVIDIDPARVVPDPSVTLAGGAIAPWQSGKSARWQARLMTFAEHRGIPVDVPYRSLDAAHRAMVFDGTEGFPGVRGYFKALEKKIYKLHVRVFLSRYRRYVTCAACSGARLKPESLAYRVGGRHIAEVCDLPIDEAAAFARGLDLDGQARETAEPLLREIVRRLDVMQRAGLDYLSLSRPSRSLSGGEYQRIILAGALGSGLVGTLYVLDEPSVGLHARDAERLMSILEELRNKGNTVVVVEHDRDIIARADHVIDIGPGAGEHGGRVVFEGPPGELSGAAESRTAAFLTGRERLPGLERRDLSGAPRIGVRGARAHNLARIDVDLPLGGLVCVTGVSGSGKSTLVEETLYRGYRAARGDTVDAVGAHDRLVGVHLVSDIVLVDQSPIGKTPRSNPVTYVKAFDGIRKLFADTREAHTQGLEAGDFSFNVPGGRCETCEGAGELKIELQFLADVYVTCEACGGSRYTERVLGVRYRDKTIRDILAMSVVEAIGFFGDVPQIARPLWQLRETGLGYLRLGQAANTLSGGEAQRLKIAQHLSRRVSGQALFILDEPTTGLHVADVGTLLGALEKLIDRGHSVLLVEHNLDVVARADWIVDLGPDGGARGGRVVAAGPPEAIAADAASITGRHLAMHLETWGAPVRSERRAAVRSGKKTTRKKRTAKGRRTR